MEIKHLTLEGDYRITVNIMGLSDHVELGSHNGRMDLLDAMSLVRKIGRSIVAQEDGSAHHPAFQALLALNRNTPCITRYHLRIYGSSMDFIVEYDPFLESFQVSRPEDQTWN